MECEIALKMAWNELAELSTSNSFKVTLLTKVYDVSVSERSVTSESSALRRLMATSRLSYSITLLAF
jgi:hypothetical protein